MTVRPATKRKPKPPPRVRRGNTEDAERMRELLTETALAQFREGGLNAVSIRGLSTRLGISAMTPYHYFADKSELLSALWQHVIEDLLQAARLAVSAHGCARDRLKAFVEAFVVFYENHPDEYRLVFLTQQAEHASERAGPEQALGFIELTRLLRTTINDLAIEVGADGRHIRIAQDLVAINVIGYLQAALWNRRYPWSDRGVLRRACVEQTALMVERCLVDGPVGTGTFDLAK